MAGFTAQGATFTFAGSLGSFAGAITGINVETPVAEIVDMTSRDDPTGYAIKVPTGEWTGGRISVDYIAVQGTGDLQSLVRGVGSLTFSSARLNVTRRCILESANTEGRVGDLIRGSATFIPTDYQGT
jgi:hypothetical protein